MATPTDAEMLALLKEAYKAILVGGQSYEIGPRKLTRANLKEILDGIEFYSWQVASNADTSGGTGVAFFGDPS